MKLRTKYHRIKIRNRRILVINNAKSNRKIIGLHFKAQTASALVLELCSGLKWTTKDFFVVYGMCVVKALVEKPHIL